MNSRKNYNSKSKKKVADAKSCDKNKSCKNKKKCAKSCLKNKVKESNVVEKISPPPVPAPIKPQTLYQKLVSFLRLG